MAHQLTVGYDPSIFCSQTHGGISRYFCEIASRIGQFPEAKTTIVAPLHINTYLCNIPRDLVAGFKLPVANFGRRHMQNMAMLIGDRILKAKNPDIIHETYYSPRRIGPNSARRVLTIYDMIHEKFASDFHPLDRTSRCKELATERADHIIFISNATRRDAVEILGLPIDKTSVIHLGYGLMTTHNVVNVPPPALPERPFLLFVGNRNGYKNFLGLIKALGDSKLLRTEYRLICFGGGPLSDVEMNVIRSFGLNGDRVIQIGGDDDVLANLYRKASAFIYPSLYEGFGIPPLEAMSFDCPVVCSNTSSIPEIVGDAGEYFDPSNTESMHLAIERVLDSDTLVRNLRMKGRTRLTAFSWDRCAYETFETYKKLV